MSRGGYVAEDKGLIDLNQRKINLRILLSYHYFKNTNLIDLYSKYFDKPYPDTFLDSGAFSAATQGVQISIDEYANYIKKYEHLLTVYSNLDVIGNYQATNKNQLILEKKGLNPIPVFHTGSPFSELERLCRRYSYVALGGMVPYMQFPKKIMPFLIKAFKIAEKHNTKYHGFGCTSWQILKALNWYSVDSSSWGSGFRYGRVPLFDDKLGKFVGADLGDLKSCKKHAKLFRELNFSWLDFADRKRNDRAKICAISAYSYIKAEKYLNRLRGGG